MATRSRRRRPRTDPPAIVRAPQVPFELFGGSAPAWVRSLLEEVSDSYDARVSPDTARTYAEGWTDYQNFVAALRADGVDAPDVPADPADSRYLLTIAMWLQWSLTSRPVGYRGRDGTFVVHRYGVRWSTMQTRLAGVVDHLGELGVPNPRTNTTFRRICVGLARKYASRPQRVSPLTAGELRAVIDATHRALGVVAPVRWRDEALICLVHAGVAAARLAKLHWEQRRDRPDGTVAFVAGSVTVALTARPGDPLCPVAAIAAWAACLGGPAAGPVFPTPEPDGTFASVGESSRGSCKQSLVIRVRNLASRAGLSTAASLSLPDLSAEPAARAVLGACSAEPAVDVRDRCILTLGLTAGSRRRNLAEFTVGDAPITGGRLRLRFVRSKTDPDGRQARDVVIRPVGGRYCPVGLLEAWLACYARLLGRPLQPTDPLFPKLHRSGRLLSDEAGDPMPLLRPAFADIVEARAEAAGLVGRFRSHSLRRGLATTLARRGMAIQDIARRGGWKTLDVVLAYIEEADLESLDVAGELGLTGEEAAG